MQMLNGFFDIDNRLEYLTENGDILPNLKKLVPWEDFRGELEVIYDHESKNNDGRRPFDAVMMFKVLILQSLYNLSDDEMEYQIMDHLSFMRFLRLELDNRVPDAKTIWLFRSNDVKKCQKDTDARWTQKRGKNCFGYKNHIEVDVQHKIIRDYKITDASVHESNVFEDILDETNTSRDVYADSAYRSAEHEANLKEKKFRPHLQRKGCKGHQLTSWKKQGPRTRSCVRSRIEHVFGVIHQRAGDVILRTIGISMTEVKLELRNIAYNMDRFCTLMLQNA